MKNLVLLLFVSLSACGPVRFPTGTGCTQPREIEYRVCCDGTSTNGCEGRGCCSHHRGVCMRRRIEDVEVECPVHDGGVE